MGHETALSVCARSRRWRSAGQELDGQCYPLVPLLALAIFLDESIPKFHRSWKSFRYLSSDPRLLCCIAEFSSVPNAKIQDFHFSRSSVALCHGDFTREGGWVPAQMRLVSQTGDIEDPATKAEASPKGPNHQVAQPSMPDAAPPPKPGGRPWRRRVLFALLPLVLIGGGYWYVTGGQTVSMDDAYVESDKVGVSTDVAGIVRDVDVSENQHVETGQVLYRLDDLP